MSPAANASAQAGVAQRTNSLPFALIAGWLIPGGGHFVARRWIRGVLLCAAITLMFALGLAMGGKLYSANTSDPLTMLGFAGDLGNGLLYWIGRALGLGQDPVQIVTADYGAKFIVVAGLLNFIAAVDAHNLAIGRKQ